MLKRAMTVLLCLVMLGGLVSCGAEEEGMREVGQGTILYKKMERIYDADEVKRYLDEAEKEGRIVSVEEFFEKYDLHYYKRFPAAEGDRDSYFKRTSPWEELYDDLPYYTVMRIEDGVIVVEFDDDKIIHFFKIKFSGDRVEIKFSGDSAKCMKDIQLGMNLAEIRMRDPDGFYSRDWFTVPTGFSEHYFRDGTCYYIDYSYYDYVVIRIRRYTI